MKKKKNSNYPVESHCRIGRIGNDTSQVPAEIELLITQLENHRLEDKIPQQEIADKLGVAFSTVNRWFNRKAKPNKIQIYHIQKLLGAKGK